MIFVSAGHHEQAQGAAYDGLTEYALTTAWADRVCDLLADMAVRVPDGYLKTKVAFINAKADNSCLAAELHFNSAKLWKDMNANGVIDDGEMVNVGQGSETLYYPGSKQGRQAALLVQSHIGKIYPPNRGVKEGYYQMNPAKGPDFFLARTSCPAIIIEPEFIDNQTAIFGRMDEACRAIADGLMDAYNALY